MVYKHEAVMVSSSSSTASARTRDCALQSANMHKKHRYARKANPCSWAENEEGVFCMEEVN